MSTLPFPPVPPLPVATGGAVAVNLPQVSKLTSSLLNQLTAALHVERGVVALDDQIDHAWANLPRLLNRIPPQHRTEALVRMCIAVATGLFDAAVNYAWNAVILELREKVRRFGLNVVPQITSTHFDEESLIKLRDSELLDICLKLNLISEDGYFLLSQNREIRNNFSVAHPSMGYLDEDEFLNFLSRCSRHALSEEHNPKGVDLQALLNALKAGRFNAQQREEWVSRINQTFDAQRELLVGTLSGLYCDPASSEETRQNAMELCSRISDKFTPKIRSNLVDRHQEYAAKGDEARHKASRQFLERLQILSLLSGAELHSIISVACENLVNVHNSMNNFYNEPPFASRLAEITSQIGIPESIRYKFVETVVMCGIGNRYGTSAGAISSYEGMVKAFSPAEVKIMLEQPISNSMNSYKINNYARCRAEFQRLVKLIDPASVPSVAQPMYNNVISAMSPG